MDAWGTGPPEDDAAAETTGQFSDEARKRLRDAADALARVVLQHAEVLCGSEGRQRDVLDISALNGPLSEAARRFCDARFDLTGTSPSFELHVENDEDGEGQESPEKEPTERIAVLMRHDFLITDREALMAAGRAAYSELCPDDIEDDAESDVHDVNRAVYQLMHASRQDMILDNVPGLRPDRSVQLTLDVTEPLDFDDPFAIYYGEDDED